MKKLIAFLSILSLSLSLSFANQLTIEDAQQIQLQNIQNSDMQRIGAIFELLGGLSSGAAVIATNTQADSDLGASLLVAGIVFWVVGVAMDSVASNDIKDAREMLDNQKAIYQSLIDGLKNGTLDLSQSTPYYQLVKNFMSSEENIDIDDSSLLLTQALEAGKQYGLQNSSLNALTIMDDYLFNAYADEILGVNASENSRAHMANIAVLFSMQTEQEEK